MPYHRGVRANPPEAAPQPPDAALELEFAQFSDVGLKRDHNEDFQGFAAPRSRQESRERGWIFALADGVGGQEMGEVASRMAVESVIAGFEASPAGEAHSNLLGRLVQAANIRVYDAGRAAGPGGVAMATTVVACALRFDRASVAHVGDSRCYLIRGGQAETLTSDHTVVNDQVRLGLMTARDAAHSETKHILSRSLGASLFVNVDVSQHQLQAGDILLLCSDGLHGAVAPEEIAHAAGEDADLEACARTLVDLANHHDGGDNVTVTLIRVRNVERVGMYRGRPYKLR